MWRIGTTRTRANIASTIRKRITMKISVLRMARLGHCCKHGSIIPSPGRVRSRNDMPDLLGTTATRVEPVGQRPILPTESPALLLVLGPVDLATGKTPIENAEGRTASFGDSRPIRYPNNNSGQPDEDDQDDD